MNTLLALGFFLTNFAIFLHHVFKFLSCRQKHQTLSRMTFQKPCSECCSHSLDWSIHPELISSKSICKEHCCAPLLCSSPIKAGKISYFLRWIFLPCYYYSCVVVVVGGCAFSALVEWSLYSSKNKSLFLYDHYFLKFLCGDYSSLDPFNIGQTACMV